MGTRIRTCRIKKGLSIKQLAASAGLSPEGISNIERRKTNNIDISVLAKISGVLNEPIKHLGCFENLPESTLRNQLKKAILLHGHTKAQAAATMKISPKTLYNFFQKGKHQDQTLEKFNYYIKEVLNS